MTNKTPVLYILMRSDMQSLNPGKAMAQAAHAANAFAARAPFTLENRTSYEAWSGQTAQSFGTTIVLDVGTRENMMDVLHSVNSDDSCVVGVIHDPTYPILDGSTTHLVPVDTCTYVFIGNTTDTPPKLAELHLHP